MSLYGVGLNGGITVRNLKRIFEQSDKNQNKKLDQEEFEKCLATFGFFPKKVELQALMKFFDKNKDGSIDFEEFVSSLAEPLNKRRQQIVEKVFTLLDKDKSQVITIDDIKNIYDISKNKDFISCKKSKEQILTEFLNQFEKDKDGKITKEEFIQYYADMSIGISSDEYFIEMIQNSWGISEDTESAASQEEIKKIVKALRYKLIQMTSGAHDEFLLRKVFKEFDKNNSGYLTIDELFAITIKLEIPIQKKYLQALFSQFDRNQNGMIEFDEFVYYICHEQYP